jgi:hypothetical protein
VPAAFGTTTDAHNGPSADVVFDRQRNKLISPMSVPSSVVLARELPKTHICQYCHVEQPADADHFFPHRASGGLHLKSRCRTCEKRYGDELAAATAKGQREVRHRPRSTEAVLSPARSDPRPWALEHTTTNAAPDHPGRSSFYDRYRALENQFRAQAAKDMRVYVPNVEPSGPVPYVFVTMEPSGDWASSPQEAQAMLERGFRNFVEDRNGGVIYLHHAIRHYLDAERYHITDISKAAMRVSEAARERPVRYEEWYPLLREELRVVGPDARVYAVGKSDVAGFLKGRIPLDPDRVLLHYGPRGIAHRYKATREHPDEFEAFRATVSQDDILATAKAVVAPVPAWVRDPVLRRLSRLELTAPFRLALLFTYKLAFEGR